MEILKVKDLKTYFDTPRGIVRAVDGISFRLRQGETLGVIGESGAGKSVTALTVMGLAWQMGASLVRGEVCYRGENLLATPAAYRTVRGRRIALIPQEAGAALNPVLTVSQQIEEMLGVHLDMTAAEKRAKVVKLLETVELPDPDLTARLYPHQMSGGILQRVLVAMALSCSPDIIIADEPASSLDVSIQKEILTLLRQTKNQTGMSMILIAHDLGVISSNSDRILVMFRGHLLEAGPTAAVLQNPRHPYTASLLEIYRQLEQGCVCANPLKVLIPHEGLPPGGGCVYASRCARAADRCFNVRPGLNGDTDEDRAVACHNSLG